MNECTYFRLKPIEQDTKHTNTYGLQQEISLLLRTDPVSPAQTRTRSPSRSSCNDFESLKVSQRSLVMALFDYASYRYINILTPTVAICVQYRYKASCARPS